MTFEDVEARVAAAVTSRLANATATIVLPADIAGDTVDGIFDASYQALDAGGLASASGPVFQTDEASLPQALADALEAGDQASFEIRGVTYIVVESEPDGAGWTVLRLRK